jgi:hypothetical protein
MLVAVRLLAMLRVFVRVFALFLGMASSVFVRMLVTVLVLVRMLHITV